MRILITADLHGNEMILTSFVERLRRPAHDCGVIAGDILHDNLTWHEQDRLLQEAGLADSTPPGERLSRALFLKEREIRDILFRANKPIFVVRGNHDVTHWKSERNVDNIHKKQVTWRGFTFIGYEQTEFSRSEERQRQDFLRFRDHIDRTTVLITHIPSFGVLDRVAEDSSTGHRGSTALRELIGITKPRIHLHGHSHRFSGICGDSVNGACQESPWFYNIDLRSGEIVPDFILEERL